jgi:lipoprotein-anchoring transpeptidase ErfK/SrfK
MLREKKIIGGRFVGGWLVLLLIFLACAPEANLNAQTSAPKNKTGKAQILEAETILANLGYWILKVDGVADASTGHAIIAFQKVERRKRTGVLNEAELNAMRSASRPTPKFTGEAHIEVDITRQVLFVVNENGVVTHILPVSTGNEEKYFQGGKWQTAHTVRGEFQIVRQIKGVRRAPLGNLYNPNYFYEGWAIHGSNSVPARPASHGCVRIPRFADRAFSEMIRVGMKVYVFD